MTFEEFKRRAIEDAVEAVKNNSNFRTYFIYRVARPNYILREWEEEVIIKVMALSSRGKDVSFSS